MLRFTMSMSFVSRNFLKMIVVFQVLFVGMQVFVFYPCMVGAPEDIKHRAASDDPGSPVEKFEQPPQDNDQNPIDYPNIDTGTATQVKDSDSLLYKPNWESLESRPIPEWYEDAKIGIFIHWGVFSVPSYAGSGSKAEGLAEWFWWYWKYEDFAPPDAHQEKYQGFVQRRADTIESVKKFMKNNYPPNYHYTDFAPQFTAEFFDPEHWAEVFKNSGAKYVVLTSKHHDGFTLWGSKKSWNWNAVDNGPHRDLAGDLSQSVKKSGLHMGFYHSLYEWFNPLYTQDKENHFKTQHYVEEKLMPELKELVNVYKPDIVWADGQWEAPCDYWNCTQFISWLYSESPVKDHVVTNDRWGSDTGCKHGGFLTCQDRYNPGENIGRKWENCMTIDKQSWGYRRNAHIEDYYDMDELTEVLAQTVSFGGNLLMNIGPTADGRIPPVFEERLRQLGEWLGLNGEAIYGTRVWSTQKDKVNDQVYYTKKQDGDETLVYAIMLVWPKGDQLELGAPQPTSKTEISWLGYSGPITWKKRPEGGIIVSLPKVSMTEVPCQWAWVFKMKQLKDSK